MKIHSGWAIMLGLLLAGCQVQDSSSSGSSSGSGGTATSGESKGAGDAAPGADATGASTSSKKRRSVAFVTNQIADFWKIAEAGCVAASKEFDIEVQVIMPPEASAVVQKQKVEDVLTTGVEGIAISPLDADNQVEWINSIGEKVPLITHDSDAPLSNRLVYIGMDNYAAGRACGDLLVKALPDGGQVLLCIGRLEQDNSKYRRQGVIDALFGRDRTIDFYKNQPDAFDSNDGELKGEKYTIVATVTDQGKPEVALQKAEDALVTWPDIKGMAGLFEYNPPACYQALSKAGKLGKSLGKTTGWIHRAALQMKQVEMIGGVNYERITSQGLFVTYGDKRSDGQLIECDTVVLCAGQEPLRELLAPLKTAGVKTHLIGGADEASELDAKRAIDQGTRLAAVM